MGNTRMSKKIKLICQDGESIEVDQDVAERSVLIKGMIDDGGVDEEIPLPNVKKSIYSKIEQYCIHLRSNPVPDIEKPLKSANFTDVTTPWFANFVDLDQDT